MDPLENLGALPEEATRPLLPANYLTHECISQRGKGGVYRAVDLSYSPARRVILKEGRPCGELDLDGRDGVARVQNEETVLRVLSSHAVPVPPVLDIFSVDRHYYLVTPDMTGQNLQEILLEGSISLTGRLRIAIQICDLISRIHEAGWIWRDCKPANFIVPWENTIAIDFEGACSALLPDALPWGTTGYLAPEWGKGAEGATHFTLDLYALGVTLYQIFNLKVSPTEAIASLEDIEPKLPEKVKLAVRALLSGDPSERPLAKFVLELLKSVSL